MLRSLTLLVCLAAAACVRVPVAMPGTEREAWWTGRCPEWSFCVGQGHIRRVCDETQTMWGLVGWHRTNCRWEKYDPEHLDREGVVVPYREETTR